MGVQSGCPVIRSTVVAYTAEIPAARPWGLVTGSDPDPDAAVRAMCRAAEDLGKKIFQKLWEQNEEGSPWRKMVNEKVKECGEKRPECAFSVGSVRLAYGQSAWVAYGTLLTDGAGDGTNWLQVPERAGSTVPGRDGGDGNGVG